MRARALLVVLVIAGCDPPEREYPAPFVPTMVGWEPLQTEVVTGEPTRFRLTLDWGGPIPDGLVWNTIYDKFLAGDSGFPPDLIGDLMVTRDGDAGEVVEIPTAGGGYLFVIADGWLEVCQDREYGTCVMGQPDRGYTIVGGGPAAVVDFPVDAITMVIGERRPMQPQPTTLGSKLSHEAVTYASDDDSVASVDADGLVEAHALGATRIQATGGAGTGSVDVTVVAGTPGPLAGAVLVTDRPTLAPTGFYAGRSRDTFAMTPEGYAAFVLDPDVASPDHDGLAIPRALDLVRWTGSGLGYERLNEWWEHVRMPFFDIAVDGHQVAGWLAYSGTGIVVLDRPGDVEVGGWQRRRLPMRPDLTTGAEREDGPQFQDDFASTSAIEEVRTLVSDVIVGTMSAPDGVWVAYGWGADHRSFEDGFPAWFDNACTATLRLAHVTADEITVEDVDVRFAEVPEDCANELSGFTDEGFATIAVGPPEDGSDRPTLLVGSKLGGSGVVRKWQHGANGWVATGRWGLHDVASNVPFPEETWDPDDDDLSVQPLSTNFATLGPGGGLWVGGVQRRSPYGYRVADSVFGTGPTPSQLEYATGGGRSGHAAMVSRAEPPGVGNVYSTWLYQQPLPWSARVDDLDTEGTRLSATAITPRYPAMMSLADGTRVMIERPNLLMMGLSASRSSGPGQPFDPSTAVTGASVSTIDEWIAWADGDRVFLAQGVGPVTLSVSTDHAASFAPVTVALPSSGVPLRGFSTSPGVSWLLTGATSSTTGSQLWRLDDTTGTMTATSYAAGTWPGMSSDGLSADSMMNTMILADDAVWTLSWLRQDSTTNHFVVTRRYGFDGTLLSANAAALNPSPIANLAGITGTDVLILPMFDEVGTTRAVLRSTNAGASWAAASTLEVVPGDTLPPPVLLPDGRLAVVNTFHRADDSEQVGVITTSDGVTWSAPRWVRPQGGHVQRPWLAGLDGAGDLLVHFGDAGTMAGATVNSCVFDNPLVMMSNLTGLEGLLVRVVAP